MWRLLFILTVLTASCEPYTKKHKTPPNRNQRIIKVQGPPHYNHFYGHPKPIRKRPFGIHHGDEFIKPNYPPPIPPFFNGPSTNKVKHLPRPPPHVVHKAPSYGRFNGTVSLIGRISRVKAILPNVDHPLSAASSRDYLRERFGFPYKSLPSYRPTVSKDPFRIKTASSVRPASPAAAISTSSASSVSTSSTYHSPTFSSSFASSPVSHIISSDNNNGPIREIPAPNLALKHHEYGGDIGLGEISSIGGIGIDGVSGIDSVGLHGTSGIGAIGSGVNIHAVSAVGNIGPIHGIGNIGSVHVVTGGDGSAVHGVKGGTISELDGIITHGGGVTHLEPQALISSVAKNPTGVNLDAIVKDQGIEVGTYIKESDGGPLGKEHSVEIANFDEGSSIDVTGLVKDAAGSSEHHSGYEVTEHQNHLPSNDQIIKGHDGSKLYYAPDPDPSLPVHKVPPTNDPHSTPSNGQNLNNVYLPQIPHGFSYIQGGSVGAPLSSQELFHYMHGYPAVLQQPVVAFVQQTPGLILGNNQYQQESGNGHYSQETHGNDITQLLHQPEIHNLLHNTPETHQKENPGGAYSSVVSQSVYSPQNQYHSYSYKNSDNSDNEATDYPSSEINHNFQYEPEASDTKDSLTVIRQTQEGNLNSETVKEILLEDSPTEEQKSQKNFQTILHLKNIPEVPFYSSLPNKKAAETLASLQAAGSVASNVMNKIRKADETEESQERGRKVVSVEDIGLQLLEAQKTKEKTVVDVQQSVPLYETSITSKNLVDYEKDSLSGEEDFIADDQADADTSSIDFNEEATSETFGRRLRPK